MAGFLEFLLGTPERKEKENRFTPEQEKIMDLILQLTGGSLEDFYGAGGGFEPFEKQARKSFEEETIPSLAERFTSLGAQGSSAFQQALGKAGAGLESELAALKSQYGMQRQNMLQSLLGPALSERSESYIRPRQKGLLESISLPLAGAFGGGLGEILGGLGSSFLQRKGLNF